MAQELHDHPEYAEKAKDWKKYHDLYEGRHAVLSQNPEYLWWHELEIEEKNKLLYVNKDKPTVPERTLRQIRELRSRYLNLTEPVVSRWCSFILRKDAIVPQSVIDMFGEEEYNNVDGKGSSFQVFIKESLTRYLIQYGRLFALVDKKGVQAYTVKDEESLGARPYMQIIEPLSVKNWQVSHTDGSVGEIKWLHIEYNLIEPSDPFQKPVISTYRRILALKDGKYTQWLFKASTPDPKLKHTQTLAQSWEPVGGEQTLTEWDHIPISFIDDESWIEGCSEQQLALYNALSSEGSIANHQAFQRIIVAGDQSNKEKIQFGENVVSFVAADSTVNVVEPNNVEVMTKLVGAYIDRFFKVAFNQVHSIPSTSKEAPGAESQREAKEDFIAQCRTAISMLEDVINRLVRDYGRFKGVEIKEKVKLDNNLTIQDFDKQFSIFLGSKDIIRKYETWYKASLKNVAQAQNLPELEKIIDEIESKPIAEETNPQQEQSTFRAVARGE